MVAWNLLMFLVDIVLCTSQLIHMKVQVVESNKCFNVTVVYAFNKEAERKFYRMI